MSTEQLHYTAFGDISPPTSRDIIAAKLPGIHRPTFGPFLLAGSPVSASFLLEILRGRELVGNSNPQPAPVTQDAALKYSLRRPPLRGTRRLASL